MANLIQLVKSVTGVLVIYLIAVSVEISCGGKGKGSDIILYKNNLVIRGEKGKGSLVIAEKPHHHHHGHHEEHHGGHHHHGGHDDHHYEKKLIMSVLNDSNRKNGKNGGTVMGATGSMKNKGGEMSWEDLIMGGGKY